MAERFYQLDGHVEVNDVDPDPNAATPHTQGLKLGAWVKRGDKGIWTEVPEAEADGQITGEIGLRSYTNGEKRAATRAKETLPPRRDKVHITIKPERMAAMATVLKA